MDEPPDCNDDSRERPLDSGDERNELIGELLSVELLAELFRTLSEDLLESDGLTDGGLNEGELRWLPLEVLGEELLGELERLLGDESLEELSDQRDDSLTLENDLLDP